MTHFEVAIQLETDENLNQVNSKILSALFAADIDALGVTVEQFETEPVYDAADTDEMYDYDEVQSFGSDEVIRYPTRIKETIADVDEDSYTSSLIEALKTNGDRYHG